MTEFDLTPKQLQLAQAIYDTARLLGDHLKEHEHDLNPRLLGAGIGMILINSRSLITGEDEFIKALRQVTESIVTQAAATSDDAKEE